MERKELDQLRKALDDARFIYDDTLLTVLYVSSRLNRLALM